MREIKFKVYYRESEEHNYSCWKVKKLHFTKDGIEAFIDGDDSPYYIGEDSNLVQFTGLLDQTGKEIYEGDILKIVVWSVENRIFYEYLVEVYWSKNHSEFTSKIIKVISKKSEFKKGTQWSLGITKDGEVVGNIYENKDLIISLQKEK